jgi:hypothetical protein
MFVFKQLFTFLKRAVTLTTLGAQMTPLVVRMIIIRYATTWSVTYDQSSLFTTLDVPFTIVIFFIIQATDHIFDQKVILLRKLCFDLPLMLKNFFSFVPDGGPN